jgi:vacuolar iron transporter family protein
MSSIIHVEKHFNASDSVRDVVIGMSDGLTVPFALAAGLSGAIASSSIVITAGLAEIAAGSIAMGLGGYLASKSDNDHYQSEKQREHLEVKNMEEKELEEISIIFKDYGLNQKEIEPILKNFKSKPEMWVDFMMRFELGLEEPDPKRAYRSAATIAFSYLAGGIIPLLPYFFFSDAQKGLIFSALITAFALLCFGFIKGKFTGAKPFRSALQTVLIGGLAASAAFALAKLIG